MREIKFRAWDKIAGQMRMVYVFYSNGIVELCDRDGFRFLRRFPDEAIIEQFTGLKDKNGREIYEGDVIRHSPGAAKWAIVYRMGAFCTQNVLAEMECYVISGYSNESEIIGNIHENQELLK